MSNILILRVTLIALNVHKVRLTLALVVANRFWTNYILLWTHIGISIVSNVLNAEKLSKVKDFWQLMEKVTIKNALSYPVLFAGRAALQNISKWTIIRFIFILFDFNDCSNVRLVMQNVLTNIKKTEKKL
jgi:hypothetical protein